MDPVRIGYDPLEFMEAGLEQGFAMALGGRVGTGNIAGVATAIGMGGPGALFLM